MSGLSDYDLKECKGKSVLFLRKYFSNNLREHIIAYLLVFIGIGSVSFDAYIIKHLINLITSYKSGSTSTIWITLFLLIGTILIGNIGWRLAGYYVNPLFIKLSGFVRHDLIRYLMRHSNNFFNEKRSSSMAYRTTVAGISFSMIENIIIWSIYPQIVNVILSIIILSSVNLIMTLSLLLSSGIVCFILVKMAMKGRILHIKHAELESKVNSEVQDVISNISLIRSFGKIKKERLFLDQEIKMEMDSKWNSVKYIEKLRAVHSICTLILSSALLISVVYLWEIGKATVGDVVLVSSLGIGIISATRDLAISIVDVSQHFSKLSEALNVILEDHDSSYNFPESQNLNLKGHIKFKNITFAYPGQKNIIENFYLDIKAGEKVGLVGLSGSGKTTLLSLLQRNYFPKNGSISIDNINLNDISEDDLRNNISVVSQDSGLLYRSIRDNILLGKPDASDDEISTALDNALCTNFISELEYGINTLTGDRGTKLSGGQKQRLSIARAFIKNAPILILDEATSALDNESEKLVQEALKRLSQGRTVIAIAHRLTTLKDFDRILVLDRGKIIQEGTMNDLENANGFFKERLNH